METHVNYVRVGTFVIGGFLAMILFILWLNKFGFGEPVQPYNIYFRGAISGLKVGAAVQYRGVPIGKVTNIKIDPENVEQILVSVDIQKDMVIKEDMIANLETYALTGISYIQIRGGSAEKKDLLEISEDDIPVIASRSSLIEEVSATIPEMLKKMDGLISQMRDVFSDENRESFTKTMKNIEEMTSYFKPGNGKEKDTFIMELTQAVSNLSDALVEIKSMSQEFTSFLKDNRSGLKEFTTTGLNSFTRFMTEGRESLAAIRRVSESLERSPSRFFYNDPKQGVPVR
jgi:phospholipid/cholesterol/gamma-HCH transport system substrate-binding protein